MLTKINFIINPIAGKGNAKEVIEIASSFFSTDDYTLAFHISNKQYEAIEISRQLVEKEDSIIVAVGGDGTVNEVARSIVNSNSILGIIPFGSGNGLSTFLKIPHSTKSALKLIKRQKTRKIDTATINSHFFVNVAGVGFDAEVAKDYAESSHRGFTTYLNASIKKYINYTPKNYLVKFNNTEITKKSLLISFANSNQYGYHTSIAPNACIDDGLLNMCLVEKVPAIITPFVAPMLFMNNIHKTVYHESYLINKAEIQLDENPWIHIDGEPLKLDDNKIIVEIKASSLNVIY